MRIKYTFNPLRDDPSGETYKIPSSRKDEAMDAVASFVLESVLEYTADGKSPVAGHGAFKALSKEYKKRKTEAGATPKANLELSGHMLAALECDYTGRQISLHIDDSEEAAKADGHCNLSGESKLPTRRFIPDKSETFKPEIWNGIRRILRDFEES